MLKIRLAKESEKSQVVDFFEKNLERENKAIYSREFFCPFGVSSAIKRNQVAVVLDKNLVVGALRFYPRKRDGIVSVYQFAVDKEYRGQKIIFQILKELNFEEYEFLCPIGNDFNKYYKKLGAKMFDNANLNCWKLNIGLISK